jgi:hypothetical protein
MSTGLSSICRPPQPDSALAPLWKDPRRSTRYPLTLPVRFQTDGSEEAGSGTGVTRNFSSCGLFIETNAGAASGSQVKIVVEWPVLLEGEVPLQFIALGEVIRCDESGFGMRLLRYEYRTRRKEPTGTLHSDSLSFPLPDQLICFDTVRGARPSTSLV